MRPDTKLITGTIEGIMLLEFKICCNESHRFSPLLLKRYKLLGLADLLCKDTACVSRSFMWMAAEQARESEMWTDNCNIQHVL